MEIYLIRGLINGGNGIYAVLNSLLNLCVYYKHKASRVLEFVYSISRQERMDPDARAGRGEFRFQVSHQPLGGPAAPSGDGERS